MLDSGWYERQYSDPASAYHHLYVREVPPYVLEEYLYHTSRITGLAQMPIGAKVLELGAGVGWNMLAMAMRGYDPYGIEISKTAVENATPGMRTRIRVGDIRDLSLYGDKTWPLVYSNGTLEHIPGADIPALAVEMTRVGRIQAHVLALDAADDPSHITIKEAGWWIKTFNDAIGPDYVAGMVHDVLYPALPILYVWAKDRIPYPITVKLAKQYLKSKEDAQ